MIGEIPSAICNLMSISILDLANNNLSGAIPECLCSEETMLGLYILDLHMNKFHGNIPDSFVVGNELQTLNLQNNDFDVPFPKSLVNCHDLEVLNLGNNRINDTFPHWLGTLPQLKVIIFALQLFPCFKGMMNLSNVEMKYMENPNGYYHFSLFVTMKGLDIEVERVLTVFTAVDFSSNKFQGKIPEIVGSLTSLQILNFSHNNLTGHIPSSLGNLAALESLHLSSNKLVGEIPTQLTGLKFLGVLNLSQNQLVGHIPQGNQFNTFLNDSYGGNLGLCGFPVSKTCGKEDTQEPPESVFHEEGIFSSPLDWKFAMMGYGCGLLLGLSAGYIILAIGKPEWLATMVQKQRPSWFHNEGQALLLFKQTLFIDHTASLLCNSNYGSPTYSFPKTDSWKEDSDFCLWDEVTCDGVTGHVIGLDLSCSWLYGTIPSNSTLFLLQHLKRLNLAFNNFGQSKISARFGQFPNLTHLNLSTSFFSGQVPSEISHLSKLVSLDLSRFSLPGVGEQEPFHALKLETTTLKRLAQNFSEVKELFLAGIDMCSADPVHLVNLSSSLTSLSLDDCGLNGTISDIIFQFPNLKLLKLGNNPDLLVYLPKSNGTNTLEVLDLKQTILVGELSDSIRGLKSLKSLNVANCDLNGSIPGHIPSSIFQLVNLTVLDLSLNNFSGIVESDMFSQLQNLESLDLSLNSLSLSSENHVDYTWTKLQSLSLSSCNLSEFPNFLRGSKALKFLDLSKNRIQGKIPKWTWNVGKESLLHLYLDHNFLTGHLQFPWRNAVILYLQSNLFQGVLPIPPVQISFFSIANNYMTGEIPSFICRGVIPEVILKLNSLIVFNLSHDNFFGHIPPSIGNLTNLEWLDFSLNKLIGKIPRELVDLTFLAILNLSKNQLVGPIPQAKQFNTYENSSYEGNVGLCGFPLLKACNEIEMQKPTIAMKESGIGYGWKVVLMGFSSNSSLEVFLTSKNNLIGEIPSSICNLMSISILDLSNNKLSGAIPDCLISRGKIPNLTVLDLHTNKFHGNIPDSLVVGNKLQILNLNNNDFDGPLPKSLENCHDLQVLNLGNNKINDTFPHWLGTLPRLEVLVLRSNYFHGQIRPSENESHFPALGILDLSHNEFSGFLPTTYFKNFRGNNLQILNLNNNDFDGPFPKSLENCRDLQVLNLGNNKINDTFPHWLGTLPQLQVLVLRSNYFHGQIRPSENESHFSALRILDLSNNEFSGFLPTTYFKSFEGMMNLSNVQTKSMEDFNLYYNFSVRVRVKNLDVELKRILTLFTTIDMSSNKFLGKIPEIVGDLISLQVLNFSHNSLTGDIPSSLGNLTALESLDLSTNKLVGQIPMQLIGLIFLEVLNLSQNQLVGLIPQGNQFNTFLNDSYGGNLGLCGFPVSKRCGKDEEQEPPESVFHEEGIFPCPLNWKFVMMGYGCGLVLGLSAGYIMLTIRKPEWLVRMGLDSLAVFSLFVLTVLIPEGTVTCELVTCLCTLMNEITRLSKERTCKRVTEVIRFQFKVEFFQQVIQRKNLIQHNLKNSLDDGMSSYGLVLVVRGHLFRALTTLLFIYNNLIGPIDPFEKVASLEIVSLQNNEINGPIPSSIFKLVNITHLDLSSNKSDGIFKFDKLSKLTYLWALSVSNNALLSLTSGSNANYSLPKLELSSCNVREFPNFVRNLEGLIYLNLSYNKIRVIEATMFLKLQSLDSLDLSHNIPLSQSNNSNVSFVLPNLSFYRCLLAMSNLNVLDLHTNKFHGNIPNSFVANNKLPMLNLNNNDFGGPFPKSLVNCHDLEVLNLGNNKMNDTFPYWLGTLPQLQVLVLRSNYFHGQINPSENESRFSALRILDLSNNEFFGLLPTTYLKSFKGLMTLYNVQRTSMEDLLRIQ
ncbi:Uncharacterized protein TCM_031931 [Theobroma cacao]|uniref:Uncharacterized protein n=1 Tax=Theobroma cacao TaxID=3641 RepID=A0A061F8J0_THECC|nr:Uncharacterized protein TCM_031931 [Theobroma cacao]